MPELPEVETIFRGLSPILSQQTIKKVVVREHRLRKPVQTDLQDNLIGKKIVSMRRRAKYLLFELDQGLIISHLGMTGTFFVHQGTKKPLPQKHDHILITLSSNTQLHYNDTRRFGLFLYHDTPQQLPSFLLNLGPEPLSRAFNDAYLKKRLQNRSTPIKSLLMDNSIVVGVGNIYAQESLFSCQISPLREAKSLSDQEIKKLINAIKQTLREAIAQGGTTIKDFSNQNGQPGYFAQKLNVYGRAKQPCLICKAPIQNLTQAGRTTNFCSFCQK